MTIWQETMAKRAPELNPLHMESLAFAIGSTINGMPSEFFDEVAAIARQMGPKKLADFHARDVV